MAVTFNTTLKNTTLDGLDTTFNNGTFEIRTGAPVGAQNPATGTLLVSITLPADAFAAASGGTKASQGTWQDLVANASGTAGNFRMIGGSNVMEGTVTATGGGGDVTLDSVAIVAGQQVTITLFVLGSGN